MRARLPRCRRGVDRGGHFRFRFAGRSSPFKRFIERCIAWRSRWGTVYGDQGIFVTRSAYAATPGFTIQPLFEEIALVRALKRTRSFVGLAVPLCVSPEPWERDGYLRRILTDRLAALGFLLGISSVRLARWRGALPVRAVPHPAVRRRCASDGHEAHKL